jgi:hypothetical protein
MRSRPQVTAAGLYGLLLALYWPATASSAAPSAASASPADSSAASSEAFAAEAAARHAKRTACLKQAKTKKLVGAKKTAFIKDCMAAR